MSEGSRRPDRLSAVERWKSSELEDARLKMARLNSVKADKQAAMERIEGDIESLHALAREQAAELSPLDAEALLRLNEFNAHQRHQLQIARDIHEQAARQADDAQNDVLRLFENLSVVQRLLERRQELSNVEQQRLAQKQLDEGALTRAPLVQADSNDSEDHDHGT
jgi:hypothetical protein